MAVLQAKLRDYGSTTPQYVDVTVEHTAGGIEIRPAGYGDASMLPGYGCPVIMEYYEGKLRLLVWPDINSDEPHIINLEGA